MNLANSVASSLSGSTDVSTSTIQEVSSVDSVDGISVIESDDHVSLMSPSSSPLTSVGSSALASRPKSVSKENELLLKGQNEALAEEYLKEVWAHESAVVSIMRLFLHS